MNPADIEEVILDIIREKDFADYNTIDVVLANMCKAYIAGVEGADEERYDTSKFAHVSDYCDWVSAQLSSESGNYLLDAVAGYLNVALQAKLEAAAKTTAAN